jgi:CheY-like chemotaxis protein
VRYTARGGVVVGARRRGNTLRLEVWDSGPGIPEHQRRNIFAEFYQLAGAPGRNRGGLGLGLAIVERLCGLLEHRIGLTSMIGRGSRFTIFVPLAVAQAEMFEPRARMEATDDPCKGKLVVVVDDDPMVLDGMRGLLTSWGCCTVAADCGQAALARLAEHGQTPDLIISDYQLQAGQTGIELVAKLRSTYGAIPAFLISGDTSAERLREAAISGYQLLHKPMQPMALRAVLVRLLKNGATTTRGLTEVKTQAATLFSRSRRVPP